MTRPLAACVSALALSLALGACSTLGPAQTAAAPAAAAPAVQYARDIHSFARPEEARVSHVSLDLETDFERKIVTGSATLTVAGRPGATEVVLDVKGLDIQSITSERGAGLPFRLGPADPILGQPLTITLPAFASTGDRRRIIIRYATAPDAAALQWLSPAQTAGGKLPYLFSQGQAILTRTWIPTQDSPGIRQTWDATITTPWNLKAVMSAEGLEADAPAASSAQWRFREPNPVPPYLIALAVGDVAFQGIDERTGVWTEPSGLHRAHEELIPTAEMVDKAEALYGPYRWGRYDVLVLPPSFPFGGMENPRLTFATPTIIAGDRSLVSLVAHELAHSWSGNLVTNATWADFWLNEGFTVYFENRIMEAVYGRDRAMQEQVLGYRDLQKTIAELQPEDTRLKLDLTGRDPDDGLTDIAYEKGALFLRTIERIVGRERFDVWLRGYFDRHAFKPMTTELFLADIREHLVRSDQALEAQLMMDAWIYQPGLPSNAVAPVSVAFEPVDVAAMAFFVNRGSASAVPWASWNTQQRQRFLGWRPEGGPAGADWLTPAQLADLERTLDLANEGNAEVLFAWLQVALQHRYEPAVDTAERFLTTQGRRKFVLPLFTTLWNEGDWGRAHARRIYAKARPRYHPVTYGSVDAVVGKPG